MDRNQNRILFFDTETSGFKPGNICQLSYIIQDGKKATGKNFFFKVNFVELGAKNVHGLSVEKLIQLSNNQDFKEQIDSFKEDFEDVGILVGHNLDFDLKFIRSEFKKTGHGFTYEKSLCTMKYFTNICKVPSKNGYGYKWPKLIELTDFFGIYDQDIKKATEEIFTCKGIGFHDARYDTAATYLAYVKAVEQGLIKF